MNANVKAAFEKLVAESGVALKESTQVVLDYTATRTAHLQMHATEPGFTEMLAVEARNVAQFAGIETARMGDARDAAIRAQVFGFLLALLASA